MKIVSIMQPTYLPWIGYFALIDSVDTFVLLDSVQFNKRSWQQRNRIKSANGELILTIPVDSKKKQEQNIESVTLNEPAKNLRKHLKSLELNYKKAPFFSTYYPTLETLYSENWTHLAEFNITLIKQISSWLQIETKFVRSHDIMHTDKKALLMLELCKQFDADIYIAVLGAKDYMDESKAFDGSGIAVDYFQFEQPTYNQLFNGFIPNLSALDLLFNAGPQSR